MHIAGGAAVAGLGGGSVAGGAAGAGISAALAGNLNDVSNAITGASPTGNADADRALGNIIANALATGAGAVVGGINVKGNTELAGAYISSDADSTKNSLTTGTLTFSDITNTSNYDASSSGFSAGGSMGASSSGKANGVSSLSNGGGVSPMISQNDSGNETARTKSAISAGTITITDSAHQTQDIASLNRDTTDLNGTVSKLPDLANLLNQQASTPQAAAIVAQTVATQIGNYADRKKREAEASGDQATADKWKEGGEYRVAMHIAGGAAVAGLGEASPARRKVPRAWEYRRRLRVSSMS